jgi:hypothetical protein
MWTVFGLILMKVICLFADGAAFQLATLDAESTINLWVRHFF